MRTFFFICVTAAVLLGGVIPVTAAGAGGISAAGSDPDLVGWWKLDGAEFGVTRDSSGHGYDGLVWGNPQWVQGYLGGAVQVDGFDDYMETNCREDLAQWTVSTWVKSPAAPSGDWAAGPVHREANYQLNWNHQDPRFRGAAGVRTPDDWHAASFGLLLADTWYHLAATFDGMALRAYKNGTLVTTDATAQGIPWTDPNPLTFGRHASAPQFFAGTIDDVRVYRRALTTEEIQTVLLGGQPTAGDPQPEPGAEVDIDALRALYWSAGAGAVRHDVYLGTDKSLVETAERTSPLYQGRLSSPSFPLAGLVELGGRYFWRIDEVAADGVTIHKGTVWDFSVSRQILVDDFESYTDEMGQRIDDIWIDGSINGTGAQVGHLLPPFAERTIVHGGVQSMPLSYNNTWWPYYSETVQEFPVAQDWTLRGAQTLSLWRRGDAVSFGETAPGVFTMTAIGTDIWSASDQFRYACKRLDGDGSITARVDSVTNSHEWAKIGVMIRANLEPDSPHAFLCVTPDGRRAFQSRPDQGSGPCVTAHSYPGTITLPLWLRLEREGNQFTAYYSVDGATWIKQPVDEDVVSYQSGNPQSIFFGPNAYIGLAASSHNSSVATTVQFSGVEFMGDVFGDWEVASIGAEQPGNSPADLHVALEDGTGGRTVVTHPNPGAVNTLTWAEWRVPLSSFTDVNLCQVKRISIGVGSSESPTPNGTGCLYIDDVTLSNQPAISTFGIYLVETGDLLLCDQDIAAYVQATHTLELNASGVEKWNSYVSSHTSSTPTSRALKGGLYQKEFAVRLDDEECYRGRFWSAISSVSCAGVVILDAALPCDSTRNTIHIEYGYPAPLDSGKGDPRNNQEIFDFFAGPGKLK